MSDLSKTVLKEFADIVIDKPDTEKETTAYGTTVESDGVDYVRLDGSNLLTPIVTTTDIKPGDRVLVMIKNHQAIIIGNSSNPSVGQGTIDGMEDTIIANEAKIKELVADNVVINDTLTANKAQIDDLIATNVTINGKLEADRADITRLDTEKLNADEADIRYAKVEDLEATNADIVNLRADHAEFKDATIKRLDATDATIKNLDAEKVNIKDAEIKYAEIEELIAIKVSAGDFEAYKATIEKLFALYASIEYLEANYIKAQQIDAEYAKIKELDAVKGNFETLKTEVADITKLVAEKADIEDLNAINATIEILQADFIKVEELVATKVDAEYVQAEIIKANQIITEDLEAIHAVIDVLDAKYATIEYLNAKMIEVNDLIAKKADIEELKAAIADIGKINADLANINSILAGNIGTGLLQTIHLTAENVVIDDAIIKSAMIDTIDTKVVNVVSGDGGLKIIGNTQQWYDSNGKIRMQAGQDAQGNFVFAVFGEDGKTAIFNEHGITELAIPDGIIKDDMVADDADIQAKKIQYIDKEGNTTLQTHLDVEQGKIEALIKETTIENDDGTTTSIKDKFLEMDATVDGLKVTVGDVSTDMETMNSKMTELETTAEGLFLKVQSIGGQNLFYYSSKEWLKKGEDSTMFLGCISQKTMKEIAEKTVTLSFNINLPENATGHVFIKMVDKDGNEFKWFADEGEANRFELDNSNKEVIDGRYIKTFTIVKDIPEMTPSEDEIPMFTMYLDVVNTTTVFEIRKGMLQLGRLATEWQPTSENVEDSVAQMEVTANKINWIVKSGTNESNFELTDRTATLVSEQINLKGLVTFNGLNKEVQDKIESGGAADIGGTNILKRDWVQLYSANTAGKEEINADEYVKSGKVVYTKQEYINLGFYFTNMEAMLPSTNYIVKFKIKRLSEAFHTMTVYRGINHIETKVYFDGTYLGGFGDYKVDLSDDEYHNVEIKFKTADEVKKLSIYTGDILQFNKGDTPYSTKVEIDNLKWERGTTATDWTPPIEDTFGVMDKWVSNAIIEGTTTINGGYIKSNTIVADHLKVDDIFVTGNAVMNIINAQEINANRITSGLLQADFISAYGLQVRHKDSDVVTMAVDQDGDVTIRGSVESYDYVTGESGWSIKADGSAEFNDVTVRGNLITETGGFNKVSYKNIVNLVEEPDMEVEVQPMYAGGRAAEFRVSGLEPSVEYTFSVYCDTLESLNLRLQFEQMDFPLSSNGNTYTCTFTTSENSMFNYSMVISPREDIKEPLVMKKFAFIKGNIAYRKQPLIWAGESYEQRNYAPLTIYDDGSIKGTQSTFSSLFTGQIKIGNISISDPNPNSGSDATFTIQDGSNGVKKVQLKDSDTSTFAQNIVISDNFYNPKITLGNDGILSVADKINISSQTTLQNNRLIFKDEQQIYSGSTGIGILAPRLVVGSSSVNTELYVYGDIEARQNIRVSQTIFYGGIVKCTTSGNGIDFNFVN